MGVGSLTYLFGCQRIVVVYNVAEIFHMPASNLEYAGVVLKVFVGGVVLEAQGVGRLVLCGVDDSAIF